MSITRHLTVLCLSLSLFFSCVSAFAVELVRDGVPLANIMVPGSADEVTLFAAGELQGYIKRISGAQLVIEKAPDKTPASATIYLGPTCSIIASDLPPQPRYEGDDKFVLRTVNNNVCIAGCSPRATLFGVYAFLEELGCRWFLPHDPPGQLPSNDTIEWSTREIAQAPSFPYRIAWINMVPSDVNHLLDLFFKQRLNICGVKLQFLFGKNGKAYAKATFPEARRRGMEVLIGGHFFRELIPAKKYFEDYPEWWPLIDGKRSVRYQLTETRYPSANLCVSNPEAVEKLLSTIENKLVIPHPDVKLWAIWPNDGIGGWCECEKCRKIGTPTDQSYYIQNLIAQRIKKCRAGKPTTYIALTYNQTSIAPDFERIEALTGGKHTDYFWYSFMVRCYHHRIYEGKECKQTASALRFPKAHEKGLSYNEYNYHHFRRYLDHFKGNGFIYEYYWHPFLHACPRPLSDIISDEVPHFYKLGVKGMSNQGVINGFTPVALNYAVHTRLLWDHRQDVEELKREYMKTLYGQMWSKAAWIYDEFEKRSVLFDLQCVPEDLKSESMQFLIQAAQMLEGKSGGSELCDREIKKLCLMVEFCRTILEQDRDGFRKIAQELLRYNLIPLHSYSLHDLATRLGITDKVECSQFIKWIMQLRKKIDIE